MQDVRRLLQLLLLLGLSACAASGSSDEDAPGETRPFVPLPDEGPEPIGYFLKRFDRSLSSWSEGKLAAANAREKNTLAALESDMRQRATKRKDELLRELESGAPANRRIAAAALGFSGDPAVLGPMLTALSDPDTELVQKSLLGIGILADKDTPLAEILRQLERAPEAWTRNNAAFALLEIARAGRRSDDLREGAARALTDEEAGVRAQCATILGVVADESSVALLAPLLHDDANLVALAAAISLSSLGRAHVRQKGSVARHLVTALDEVRADRRAQLLGALRWMSENDFGEDTRPWREWAAKLP
jgi:hypothetical protein